MDFQDRVLFGFAGLIQAHTPTIQKVTIRLSSRQHMSVPPKDLWNALVECPHLSSLELSYIRVPDDAIPLFLRVLAKPRSLILTCMTLNDWNVMDFALPGPRQLSIILHGIEDCQRHDQATLVRQCQNLEALRCRGYTRFGNTSNPGVRAFFQTLSMDPWPLSNIDTLDLPLMPFKDHELANVLKRMNRLKHLIVHGTEFGLNSFEAITMDRTDLFEFSGSSLTRSVERSPTHESRLCDSIEILKINQCKSVTSVMIQTILANCPRLIRFYADEVTITDIIHGREWVCFGLKELEIYLNAKDDFYHDDTTLESGLFAESQHEIYGRLATLTELEELHLTNNYTSAIERRTLDIRLKAGMNLLSGLTNLKVLTFQSDIHQQIGVEEALWIKQHWPHLKVLRGYINADEDVRSQVKAILDQVVIEDPCNRFAKLHRVNGRTVRIVC